MTEIDINGITLRTLLREVDRDIKFHGEINSLKLLKKWLIEACHKEIGHKDKIGIRDFIANDFQEILHNHGISEGLICEIGGPHNSLKSQLPSYEFEFMSLYPDSSARVLVADATQCEYLERGKYDAIYSVSVFEHISKPWKAAENFIGLLKPGGICYHVVPFSYFYHGAPADFWRFTPDAMNLIFSGLRTIKSDFYGMNRRRDNRGSKFNPVDKDGGAEFSIDAFGGWRENWFVIYAGVKDEEYLKSKEEAAKHQVIINLMKCLVENNVSVGHAADKLNALLSSYAVTIDEEIVTKCVLPANSFSYSSNEIKEIWESRGGGKYSIKVSYNRYVMAEKVKLFPF